MRYKAGRIEVLKHFDTAHNDLSLDHPIDQAEDFLGTNAQLTLDIGTRCYDIPPDIDEETTNLITTILED